MLLKRRYAAYKEVTYLQSKRQKPQEDVIPFMAEICPDKPIFDVYAILDHDLAEKSLENKFSPDGPEGQNGSTK